MSNKYEVDIEKLRDITGESRSYLCPEGLKSEKDRLKGMINNNVMFCALISGYRGTGKTTFVNHIIGNLPEDVITVVINAAKYTNYEVFIKRFIRELFLQYKVDRRKGKDKPESIKQLYLHTFYNLKDTNSLELKRDNENKYEQCKKKTVTGRISINLQKISGFILSMVFSSFVLWASNKIGQQFLGIISAFMTIFLYIFNNIKISTDYQFDDEKNYSHNQKENSTEGKKILIENLYDDEIAEYHLFNALKETSIKEERQLLLVLDEMDKIESTDELRKIFRDLKPLFLSKYCNVIVVAGKNVDTLLYEEEGREDSVIDSLFSQKIYVRLSTLDENKLFIENLFTEKSHMQVVKNNTAQSYMRRTVILANGNRRKLINLLLADIVWENNKPYIYLEDEDEAEGFDRLYNVMSKMEEYILSLYDDIKSDEAIYYTYQLLNCIRTKMGSEFKKTQILNAFIEEEGEPGIYLELCNELLKNMEKEKLLRYSDDKYTWLHENKEENGIKVNYSKISENMTFVKALERLFLKFGGYFGVDGNVFECIRFFFERSVIERMELSKLEECFSIYEEIEKQNIGNSMLQKLYNNVGELKRKKSLWAEKLLCLTIKKSSSYVAISLEDIIKLTGIDNWKYHYGRHDAILYDSSRKKILIAEFKFYQNYLSGIDSKILESLNEIEFIRYQCEHVVIEIEFMLVFLVDTKVPSVRKLLKDSIERMKNKLYEDKRDLKSTYIEVVALDDSFNDDLKRVMENLR